MPAHSHPHQHLHESGVIEQLAPDFDGSTFVQPADLLPPAQDLPLTYVTSPDTDGACRFDFVDEMAERLGNPPDYCHLYIWDHTIIAFHIQQAHLVQSIQSNAHPANHPFQARLWQGHRYGEKMPNGNLTPIGILPNTLTCLSGLTLEQFKFYIASQTKNNYYRTPYSSKTTPPQPIGG